MRTVLLALSILLCLAVSPAKAQTGPSAGEGKGEYTPGPTVITLAGASEVRADPGAVVTLPFMVQNLGTAALGLELQVDLPEGWTIVTAPVQGMVSPGARALRIASVRVPA